MIDYRYKGLYTQSHIHKKIEISVGGTSDVITNSNIHWQQFELNETLCSEQMLTFGCCETASIKFTISNDFEPLKGKSVTVTQTLQGGEDEPFTVGTYKVVSEVPTADRAHREVTAYDAMADILAAEVSDWYVSLFPTDSSTVTLRQFRDSFFRHLGITQRYQTLPNDAAVIEKTVDPSELSGREVITAICEINGCFGHIGRDGKFCYVFLEKGSEALFGRYPGYTLYPGTNLYPDTPAAHVVGKATYIKCEYEDYLVNPIDKLQIRETESDIGAVSGTGNNCYVIENNFLVYGKSAASLQTIADRAYEVISGISYYPIVSCEAVGNPCLEVGDATLIQTKTGNLRTYILERRLSGIQSLRDVYSAKGVQNLPETKNTVAKSIIQLRGKTNTLVRDVEHTQATIRDVQAGLESEILQTAQSITSTVSSAQDKYDTGDYNISIAGYRNPSLLPYTPSDYSGQYYLDNSTGYVYQSDGTAWNKVDELELISENLNTKIEETAQGLTVEINKKVGDNEVVTKINASAEGIQIDTDKMDLNTSGWNIMSNGNFSLGQGALTYVVNTPYIVLKNGLSLMLDGIPLSGQKYYFSSNGYKKWDIENEQYVDITVADGAYAPSFRGVASTGIDVSWYLEIVQFPNQTTVSGLFSLGSRYAGGYLFENMLPIRSRNTTGIADIYLFDQSDEMYKDKAKYTISAIRTKINNDTAYRYRLGSIVVDRALNANTETSSAIDFYEVATLTYISEPIPLDELLVYGYIDIPI